MIPAKIGEAGYRFIKLKVRGKVPMEKGYKTTRNYAIDDPRLIQWITPIEAINPRWNGLYGNYGVLAQPGTGLIDGDNQDIVDYTLSLHGLEDAFRVQSGSGRGAHIYFTTNSSRTIPLLHEGLNIGHIKGAPSGYVVGPGSVHPEGGIYRILHDGEIPFIPFEKIVSHFDEFIIKHPEPITPACQSCGDDLEINIPITSILEPIKAYRKGNYIIGGNPYGPHENKSNSCLQINTAKNTWRCWACHEDETWGGGGPAQAIALKHGILPCCEIGAGALRGKLYAKVLDIAESEYGWKNTRDSDIDLSDILKTV